MYFVPLASEKELFDRVSSGDQAALKELYYAYYGKLSQVAMRITRDHPLAEDIAQQAFIQLWSRRAAISIESGVYSYLRKITINIALEHMRKQARRVAIRSGLPQAEEAHRDSEDYLAAKELRADIVKAVEGLPDQCRAVFKLSRYEEMSYREIAETLEISPKTVENHMGKALKMLRESLRGYLSSLLF